MRQLPENKPKVFKRVNLAFEEFYTVYRILTQINDSLQIREDRDNDLAECSFYFSKLHKETENVESVLKMFKKHLCTPGGGN